MSNLKSSAISRLRWMPEAESGAMFSAGYSSDGKVTDVEIHCMGEKRRFCLRLDETECNLLLSLLSRHRDYTPIH